MYLIVLTDKLAGYESGLQELAAAETERHQD